MWLKEYFFSPGAEPRAEAVVLWWGALVTGYLFMLRASEYLVQPDKSWSLDCVAHGIDIQGLRNGSPEGWPGSCDEIALTITSTKTDQCDAGCHRNHFRSERRLCVLSALAELQREYPQRFERGLELGLPFFRHASGRAVTRGEVQGPLRLATPARGAEWGQTGVALPPRGGSDGPLPRPPATWKRSSASVAGRRAPSTAICGRTNGDNSPSQRAWLKSALALSWGSLGRLR
jgi:hypothetical protein